jgi:hypothetical protein
MASAAESLLIHRRHFAQGTGPARQPAVTTEAIVMEQS